MLQNTKLTIYLMFGISLFLFNCCNKKDYAFDVEFVYINKTDSNININNKISNLKPENSFNYFPQYETTGKDDDIKKVVGDLYIRKNEIIYYGCCLCDTLNEKSLKELGPVHLDNYIIEKKGKNEYKCTFVFTKEMLNISKLCQ